MWIEENLAVLDEGVDAFLRFLSELDKEVAAGTLTPETRDRLVRVRLRAEMRDFQRWVTIEGYN